MCWGIRKVSRVTRETIKKWLMIIIGCSIVLQILVYKSHTQTRTKFIPNMNFSNINTILYMRKTNVNEFNYQTETVEEVIEGDRNIFFLETGHIKRSNEINLNARQGCAVESAALMNPKMNVHLFIFSTELWKYSDNAEAILTQLKSYKNIVIRLISLEKYFENSPMDEWWNITDGLSSSKWFTSHMSDALRYFTLWKFGGIYLDLDVVIKSSLEHLKNFAAAEDSSLVAAGVLGFDAMEVGRRYANACLFEIMTDFHGDEWAHNGPGVITRTLKKMCSSENLSEMTPERCGGFKVFPPSAFYPIFWTDWEQYFNVNDKNETMKSLENALAIHVWNKMSQSRVIDVGSEVPYELIARKYCPKVYKNCGNTF